MTEVEGETAHIQVSFFTKQPRFAIPNTPFSIPVTVARDELGNLINQLLKETTAGDKQKEFDFLIDGKLIRGTLKNHIAQWNIPVENVIEIECIERNPPPSLSEEIDHKDWVSCVHCSGMFILTGCYDGSARIWTHDGQLVCVAGGHSAAVKDVQWITTDDSSEEQLFLSASQDQNVLLWKFSPASSEVVCLHQCKGHARSVEAIAVSPDTSKFCSVSWDKYLKIWSAVPDSGEVDETESEADLPAKKKKPLNSLKPRTTTRTPLLTLTGHTQPASAAVWVREEEVVTAGWDHCIRLWDVTTGVNKATLTGSKVFHDIDYSPFNSLLASANSDKYVRIWDTRQSESSVVQCMLSSHQGWVVGVHWSPENEHQLLSGSYDSTLRLWDTRSQKVPLFTIAAHEGKVLCLDWTLPKILASGGSDNQLRTYTI